jgi:hypothetical protein
MNFKEIKFYLIHVTKDEEKLQGKCTPENLEVVQLMLIKDGFTVVSIEPKVISFIEPTTEDLASLTIERL